MSNVKDSVREHLKKVITEYSEGEITAVEIYTDPVVVDSYAVRAYGRDKHGTIVRPLEFVLVAKDLEKAAIDDLEEVEFTYWPPRSGGPATTFLLGWF